MRLINISTDEIYLYGKFGSPYGNGGLFHIELGEPYYLFQSKIGFSGKGGWNVVEDYELLEDRYHVMDAGVPVIYDAGRERNDKSGLNILFLLGVLPSDGFFYDNWHDLGWTKVVACARNGDLFNMVLKIPCTMQYMISGAIFDCNTGSLVTEIDRNFISIEDFLGRILTAQPMRAIW